MQCISQITEHRSGENLELLIVFLLRLNRWDKAAENRLRDEVVARLNVGDIDGPVERERAHAVDVQLMLKLKHDSQLLIKGVVGHCTRCINR